MTNIILYGIANEESNYRARRYFIIAETHWSIRDICGAAERMIDIDPTIEEVYALDNRRGLKNYYTNARNFDASKEECMKFRDILKEEGLFVISNPNAKTMDPNWRPCSKSTGYSRSDQDHDDASEYRYKPWYMDRIEHMNETYPFR